MNKHLTITDITKLAALHRIWATEMDIVASKTRELSILKERQVDEVNATLKRVAMAISC
ncbi:MAG: hypothetical protein RPR40_06810 [Bermanella sp.]